MKICYRLGVLATAVSGLLAAGLLFSAPAFAWHADLTDVSTSCPPGSENPRVDITLKFDTARSGHVKAAFQIGDGDAQKVDEDFSFNDVDEATFSFSVDNPDEDSTITVFTKTVFDGNDEKSFGKKEADLKKCEKEETTTTEAPTTPKAPTALGPSTTEAAPQSALPFTGSSTLPLLVTALVLMVGGGAALFATRIRGRHAK